MKTDAEFLSALSESQAAVNKVATWLKNRGAYVTVPEVKVRPSFDQRMDYQDDGDILITQRVEVKHKQVDFTSEQDYPYETLMLDASYKIDALGWGHLDCYVLMNKAKTHVAVVPAATRGFWEKTTVCDRKERDRRCYYVCPKHLATFFSLQES